MAFDTVTKEITIYSNVSLIDLSLDSFNLNEIQAFNSFYNNLFFFEWYIMACYGTIYIYIHKIFIYIILYKLFT